MAKWVCTLALAVAGHTHGLSIRMVSILWCALTRITQGYWRTPPRTSTECARIGRSVTRRTSRRRTLALQIFLTLMNQGRSAFGSRSSSPWMGVKSGTVQVWRRPSQLQHSLRQEAVLQGGGRGRINCIFVADIVVLAAGSPLKPPMPITIQSSLPHIIMKFGETLDSPNCPEICMAVDSCTALTTGSFHFYAQIMKRFPHCVAKI
jgi:hypothetical protein